MSDSALPDFRDDFAADVSERGVLVPLEPGRFAGWLLKNAKKRITVTLSRAKVRRSTAANAYYWSMVVPVFSEVTGYEKEEAHEILKALFLRERVTLPNGTEVERVRSSAGLDTAEFAEYVEQCCRWLAAQGWYVAQPGERLV